MEKISDYRPDFEYHWKPKIISDFNNWAYTPTVYWEYREYEHDLRDLVLAHFSYPLDWKTGIKPISDYRTKGFINPIQSVYTEYMRYNKISQYKNEKLLEEFL